MSLGIFLAMCGAVLAYGVLATLYLYIKLKIDLRALRRRRDAEIAEAWRRYHEVVAYIERARAEREALRKAHQDRWLAKFRAAKIVGSADYSQPPSEHE